MLFVEVSEEANMIPHVLPTKEELGNPWACSYQITMDAASGSWP